MRKILEAKSSHVIEQLDKKRGNLTNTKFDTRRIRIVQRKFRPSNTGLRIIIVISLKILNVC